MAYIFIHFLPTAAMTLIKPHERISLAQQIGHESVFAVVNEFYDLIQHHHSLAIPFGSVEHWDEHKKKITEFWWTALGGQPTESYQYNPVAKHAAAGFNHGLLEDWKNLFKQVLSKHLTEQLAAQWFDRVTLIGSNLERINDQLLRENTPLPPK
jgi:hemoglobin